MRVYLKTPDAWSPTWRVDLEPDRVLAYHAGARRPSIVSLRECHESTEQYLQYWDQLLSEQGVWMEVYPGSLAPIGSSPIAGGLPTYGRRRGHEPTDVQLG